MSAGRCGSPSSPTSGCTGWTPGSSEPVAVTPEPPVPAGVRHADLSGHCPTAGCWRSGRRIPRRTGPRPTSSTRSSASSADGTTSVLVSGPDFVSDPRPGARRRHAVLAAVGPPEHAVGHRPARRPRRRRHRARDRRRAGRVRRPAGLGRGPGAVVAERPHRRLVAVPPSAARRGGARARRGQRHRRPAVGVRAEPLSPCSPTAGSCSPTAAPAPTGSPSWSPTATCASSTCRTRRSGTSPRRATAVVCVAGGPSSEPVVLRVDVDGGRARGAAPGARPRPGPGLVLPARARHVPDRGPRHRHRRGARAGLPADQPGGRPRPRASCRR